MRETSVILDEGFAGWGRNVRSFLVLMGLAVGLAGCAQPPPRSDTFYRLELPAAQRLPSEATSGILEVARLDVDGVLSQRSLAYIDERTPINVQSYRYEYWTDAPGMLVQSGLVDFLRQSNIARTVLTPDARATADYTLRGRIKRFEQVLAGKATKGVAEIEFTLSGRDGKLLLVKRYMAEAPAASDSPQAAIRAITEAVGKIAAELARDIAAAARG